MSATYLVRMAIDKELLGVFWAENLDELAIIIDGEIVDPMLCEIKKIKNGGIFWGPVDVKVPLADEDYYMQEDDQDPFGDAIKKLPVPSLGGDLCEDLTSGKGWRKFSELVKYKTLYA